MNKTFIVGAAASLALFANVAFAGDDLDISTHIQKVCDSKITEESKGLSEARAKLAEFIKVSQKDREKGFYTQARTLITDHLETLKTIHDSISPETAQNIKEAMGSYKEARQKVGNTSEDVVSYGLRSLHIAIQKKIEGLLTAGLQQEGFGFEDRYLTKNGERTPWRLHLNLGDGKEVLVFYQPGYPEFYATAYEQAAVAMRYQPLTGEITVGQERDSHALRDQRMEPVAELNNISVLDGVDIKTVVDAIDETALTNAFIRSWYIDQNYEILSRNVTSRSESYQKQRAECSRVIKALQETLQP